MTPNLLNILQGSGISTSLQLFRPSNVKSRIQICVALSCVALASCTDRAFYEPDPTAASTVDCRFEIIKHDLFVDHSNGVLVAAHRGAHNAVPENSVASILAAIEMGVDIVEVDVMISRDGHPVLMHDKLIDRTTNARGSLSDLTLAELRVLRLRNPDGSLSEEMIPTLAEVLEAARGRIFVNIDLKTDRIEPVVDVVRAASSIEDVMFYSSSLVIRQELRKLAPEAIVMPIAREPAQISAIIDAEHLQILHLVEDYNSPSIAEQMDGLRVAGWTNALGKADQRARDKGAEAGFGNIVVNRPDVIQTDEPAMLLDYLRTRRLHWSSRTRIECPSLSGP